MAELSSKITEARAVKTAVDSTPWRPGAYTIRVWSIAVGITVAVPIVIFAAFATQRLATAEQAAIHHDLVARTEAMASKVDRYLGSLLEISITMANSPEAMSNDLSGFYEFAKRTLATGNAGRAVNLIEPGGQFLVTTRRPFGEPLPMVGDRRGLAEIVVGKVPRISDLFKGAFSGRYNFDAWAPVVLDGKLRSYVAVAIEPQDLTELLREENLPEGWIATVEDRQSVIVARTRDPDQWVGQKASPQVIAEHNKSPRGDYTVVNKDGTPVAVYFVRLPSTGWVVTVGAPRDQLGAPAFRSLLFTSALALITLATAAVLGAVISRSLGREIKAVVGEAAELGEGRAPNARPFAVVEFNRVSRALTSAYGLINAREAALTASEERLRLFITYAPAAIAMFDNDMRYLVLSQRWLSDFKIKTSPIGCSHYEIFPEIREDWKAVHRRCLAGAVERSEGDRFERRDGSIQWLRWEVRPWFNALGAIGGILISSEDVTEQKKMEELLRHNEERLRLLGDNLPDSAVYQYTIDAAGQQRFIYLSAGFERVNGIRVDDALRDPDVLLGQIPPEYLARMRDMRARSAADLNDFRMEAPIRRPDGELRWILFRSRPQRLPDGGTLWHGVETDITDRRRMEEELHVTANRFDVALKSSPIVLFCQDLDLRYTWVYNPAFGVDPADIIGKRDIDLLERADDAHAIDAIKRAVIQSGVGQRHEVGVTRQGVDLVFDLLVEPLRDRDERIVGVRCAAIEITERKRAADELTRSQRAGMAGALVGGVAHDFNNLLAVIAGNLELVEPAIPDQRIRDVIRGSLAAIQAGAALNRRVQRILSLGRRRTIEAQSIVLSGHVTSTLPLLAHILGKNINMTTDFADDLWPVVADAGEIDSAIFNLILNARDAMPNGGKLGITAANISLNTRDAETSPDARPGDYVKLSIVDTGIGMTPSVVARVGQPFFTTKESGTGLGLSGVFAFVKAAGGFVQITSGADRGTTVSLFLPRALNAPEVGDGAVLETAPPGDGELILVVEDDDRLREVTLRRLEALGYAVIEARTGPEAVKQLRDNEAVDLVFSDIGMPGGMTGSELAKWIVANKPQVKTLLTSGFTRGDPRRGDHEIPEGVAILDKPYSFSQLAQAVRAALDVGKP